MAKIIKFPEKRSYEHRVLLLCKTLLQNYQMQGAFEDHDSVMDVIQIIDIIVKESAHERD